MKFGFNLLPKAVRAVVEAKSGGEIAPEKVEELIKANLLLSNIREDVGLADYTADMYLEDYKLIEKMLDNTWGKTTVNIPTWVKSYLEKSNLMNTLRDSVLQVIAREYKYLFQDGFGLKSYVGVLTFQNGIEGLTIGDTLHEGVIKGAKGVFGDVSRKLSRHFSVKSSTSRQFKLDEILASDKPVYFHYKMLEYALGRKLTKHTTRYVYEPLEGVNSWEDYWEKYAKEQINSLLYETMYKALMRIAKEDLNTTSGEVQSRLRALFETEESKVLVDNYLSKVQKSLCTCVIVRTYNSLSFKPNAISIRVVDTRGTLDFGLTKNLFSGLSTDTAIQYEDGILIGENLTYPIVEYRHDFDEELSNAEPLFGYKAVELYAKRGIPLSWDKIMLGEDYKGTPIFASLSSKDDIAMQSQFVHNVFAGSRAGKGVMTMNLIACAMAAGKPVFYIDRKPDMALLFHELSGGNMFLVNGGQQNSTDDYNGIYQDGGTAIKGWSEAYDSIPDYLRQEIFNSKTYSGAFGDMIYLRAVLFVLGIISARVEIGNEDLGGGNGILVVIDEFSNWQNDFEGATLVPGRGFFKNLITSQNEKEYNRLKISIMTEEAKAKTAKPEQAPVIEVKINSYKEQQANCISPLKVYCTELKNKIKDTMLDFDRKISAGFKNHEGKVSDVFVIGQLIEKESVKSQSSDLFDVTATGDYSQAKGTKKVSVIRTMLNQFEHDWFLGKNLQKVSYWGQSIDGSKTRRWLYERAYWGYTKGSTENDELENLRDKEPSDLRIFKPYLVLNNNLEDDPERHKAQDAGTVERDELYYKSTYVHQCRGRINDAVPGAHLWESIRLKHLNKPDGAPTEGYDEIGNLHTGIGFEGLTSMVKKTNGLGDFNPAEDLSTSKQIADFVAQKMGYSDYWSLLTDFSPEGMFSSQDIVEALRTEGSFQNTAVRLPTCTKYGLVGGGDGGTAEELMPGVGDDDFYSEGDDGFAESADGYTEGDDDFFAEGSGDGLDNFGVGGYGGFGDGSYGGGSSSSMGREAMNAWNNLGHANETNDDYELTDSDIEEVCMNAIRYAGVALTQEQISTFINNVIRAWRGR